MQRYIRGWYCADREDIELLSNEKPREMLKHLMKAYPESLSVDEICEKAEVNIKTGYPYLEDLRKRKYIKELKYGPGKPKSNSPGREKARYIIEDMSPLFSKVHNADDRQDEAPFSLPPGHVSFYHDFLQCLQDNTKPEEKEKFITTTVDLVTRILRLLMESEVYEIKKYSPRPNEKQLCSQCNLNHEARDCIRAILLFLVGELEKHPKYLELLVSKGFLSKQKKDQILKHLLGKGLN